MKPRRAEKNKEKLFKVGREESAGGRKEEEKQILPVKVELTVWNLG